MKSRLDSELVRRKIARSRDDARELIESGSVLVNGIVATKVATLVAENASIALSGDREEYVSRGARKLVGALDSFGISSFEGLRVLDAGASTGGFTEVLLRRGASKVYAVDVGYGQLAWSLQSHPQVRVMDRTNVRGLTPESVEGRVDVVVADLSFISLTTVLPVLVSLTKEEGELFLMVKPQFEVGREQLGSGGVVREPELRAAAVRRVTEEAWKLGFGIKGIVASSLPGPAGNVEYFIWLRKGSEQLRESDLARAIEEGPS